MKEAILAYLRTKPPQGLRKPLCIAVNITTERPVSRETVAAVRAALDELVEEGKIVRTGNGRSHAYSTTEHVDEILATGKHHILDA